MRGRALHSPTLHALAPCSTLSCAFLPAPQTERSGHCLQALHLPQVGTNPVLEAQQTPSPARSCLCMATLCSLISCLQLLCRLVPTVTRCLTSHLLTSADSALLPTLTTLLAYPWPHLPPSPPCRERDHLPVALSLLTALMLPPWSLLSPLTAPCLLSHSPSKTFIYFPAFPPAAVANPATNPLLLPDLEMQPGRGRGPRGAQAAQLAV